MERCGRRRGGVGMGVCTGGLVGRVGGRVRRVWMVLDGSKEASLPSCGDKPSLALQHRVTHSIAQWRIFGSDWLKRIKKFVGFFCILEEFPPLTRLFRTINQMHPPPHFLAFYIPSHFDSCWTFSICPSDAQYIINFNCL